jgi:hypothetical protein
MSILTMRRQLAKALAKPGWLAISEPPLSAWAAAPDCRRRKGKSPSDAITATEPGRVLPGDRLDPAECLLDALADALAFGIAAVPGGSPVNRRTAAVDVLRNMRRYFVERSSLTKSSVS